jgi:hypothetical protein
MNPQKWAELARAEGDLQILRINLAQNTDHSAASRIRVAIARAEKGRHDMVSDISDLVAAGC